MKVVLINPPLEMKYRLWYPLGIAYIASALLQKGFEVEIIDVIGENLSRMQLQERLKKCAANCIGIGGLVTAFNNVIDIVSYIRTISPKAFIFLGNTVGYSIPELMLKNVDIDAIVLGEGELTVVELMKAVMEGRTRFEGIKGIMYKTPEGEIIENGEREPIKNLDDLHYPAWHLLPIEQYFKNAGHRYCLVSTVRGCPYSCKYCCKTYIGYKVRYRSAQSIINELIEFDRRYHIDFFYMWDDLSIVNGPRIIEFCKLKMKSPLAKKGFELSLRANLVTEEIVKTLKDAKCTRTGMGIESLDQTILDSIGKGVKIKQIEDAVRICEKNKLDISASSFMVGAISETEETIKKSRDFCKKHRLIYEPHFMTPFPGTELYQYVMEKGLIKNEWKYISMLSKQGNTNYPLINICEKLSTKELEMLRYKYLYIPDPTFSEYIYRLKGWLYSMIAPSALNRYKREFKSTGASSIIVNALKNLRQIFINYKGTTQRYSNLWN